MGAGQQGRSRNGHAGLGKAGTGEQGAATGEDGGYGNGTQDWHTRMVRLPYIDRESRRHQQQDKGHEENGIRI